MNTLWNRNFKIYVIGIFFSVFGNSISTIALASLIFQSTGDTTDIAIVFAIAALSSLIGPIFGQLIDNANIRKLLSVVDFARALSILLFLLVIETSGISAFAVYAFAAISSALGLLYRPSIGALMPKLVGIKNIVSANSVMGMIYSSTAIAGYFIGGILVSFVGSKNALIFDALTFVLMGGVFLSLQERGFHVEKQAQDTDENLPVGQSIMSTLSFIVSSGIIVIPLVIVVTGIAVAPFQVEWPRLLSDVDGGVFFALMAGGTACSSFIIYRLKEKALQKRWVVGALFCLGALTTLPGFLAVPATIMLTGLVLGFLAGFASSATFSAVQVQMPAHLRGRIFGILEPMEKLPLFVVFVIISQMTSHFTYKASFIFSGILMTSLILLVILFFEKNRIFAQAKTTIAGA